MSLTATKITAQATKLKFNPRTDKAFALITEVATPDHCVRLAQTELAMSHTDLAQGDHQSRKDRLVSAGQHILLALALMEE